MWGEGEGAETGRQEEGTSLYKMKGVLSGGNEMRAAINETPARDFKCFFHCMYNC